jgi:hypothetical protein
VTDTLSFPSELIAVARRKIAAPGTWTRGRMMRDATGKGCFPEDGPVAFSAHGALQEACYVKHGKSVTTLAHQAIWSAALTHLNAACPAPAIPGLSPLWAYENRPATTQADMLAVFDRAQAAARAAEGAEEGVAA